MNSLAYVNLQETLYHLWASSRECNHKLSSYSLQNQRFTARSLKITWEPSKSPKSQKCVVEPNKSTWNITTFAPLWTRVYSPPTQLVPANKLPTSWLNLFHWTTSYATGRSSWGGQVWLQLSNGVCEYEDSNKSNLANHAREFYPIAVFIPKLIYLVSLVTSRFLSKHQGFFRNIKVSFETSRFLLKHKGFSRNIKVSLETSRFREKTR